MGKYRVIYKGSCHIEYLELSSFLELSAVNFNCITTNIMEFISLNSTKCSTCTCIVLAALYQIEKKMKNKDRCLKKYLFTNWWQVFSLTFSSSFLASTDLWVISLRKDNIKEKCTFHLRLYNQTGCDVREVHPTSSSSSSVVVSWTCFHFLAMAKSLRLGWAASSSGKM